jgi:hypothetical protein
LGGGRGEGRRPLLTLYDAPGVTRACEQGISRAQAAIRAMEAKKGAGAIFDEWNRMQIALEDVANTIYLLGSVSPEKPVRDAAEPCLQKLTTLQADIYQNEKLFARVNAAQPMNPHQAKLKKDLVEGDTTLLETEVAIGAPDAPTPTGRFSLTDKVRSVDPGGAYGPFALGLSGRSEVLTDFARRGALLTVTAVVCD